MKKRHPLVQNLKARLVNTYGDDLALFQKSEGLPEVVYSTKNVSYNPRNETKETIKTIGKMIRQGLAPGILFVLWPAGEKQLLQGNFESPELTNLLLTSVLSGKGKCTKRISHLVYSIAQDLTYNSGMGRKRTKSMLSLLSAKNE